MNRTELAPRFRRLLTTIPYVTIATVCPDGKPWNTPVVGYFDDELNLYWASWIRSRHSLNIAHGAVIFVVMYDSSWPLGTGEALYFTMTACKLSTISEIKAAKEVYVDRYGEDNCTDPFAGTCPRRIYKATPLRIWSNTDGAHGAHFVDVRSTIL